MWATHLFYLLAFVEFSFASPVLYLHVLVQTYLFTGLFITAHDSMHGLVSPNRLINTTVGRISTWLFAALSYNQLLQKHKLHHRFPGEKDDPDFCSESQNFWRWWYSFLKNYISWPQLVVMAIVFNVLQIWINQLNLIFFWIIPAVMATFQLFYFGTYLPHRMPHVDEMRPHNSRTQKGPHWWAMLSCYFFGYHFEHHDSPHTPWWKLYRLKNQNK